MFTIYRDNDFEQFLFRFYFYIIKLDKNCFRFKIDFCFLSDKQNVEKNIVR